jgi:hypothetical protein
MNLDVSKIARDVLALVPGTKAHIAAEKRRVERALRAAGWSRSAAVADVARRHREGTL